jgi:opacity protein-like surface antigen
MSYRSALFCAAAAFAAIGATSLARAQSMSDFYVRGDLGIASGTDANIHNRNQPVVNPLSTVAGINGTLNDVGTAWVGGIGAGLHILPNIRADFVYTYRGGFSLDEGDKAIPPNRFQADLASNAVMATAYWDLPVFGQIAAFVGAGIGWADVSMSRLSSGTGGLVVNPLRVSTAGVPVAPDGRTDNFAWQVTTGLALPIGSGVLVELFYRYFDGGHVQTPAGNVTVNSMVVGQFGGAEGALHSHELTLSLRVPLA